MSIIRSFSILALFVASFAAHAGTVRFNFLNLENNSGAVRVTVFRGEAGFPSDVKKAAYVFVVAIDEKNQAFVDIENMAPGTYAVAAFHDEDKNGDLNRGLFGAPKEAYGFSNDARGTFGPPSFEDSAFEVTDLSGHFDITLK